jgi:hypothetical protein
VASKVRMTIGQGVNALLSSEIGSRSTLLLLAK